MITELQPPKKNHILGQVIGVSETRRLQTMRRAYEIFAHPLVLVDEPAGTIRRRIDAIFLGPPDTSTALANWSYLVISNFRKDNTYCYYSGPNQKGHSSPAKPFISPSL